MFDDEPLLKTEFEEGYEESEEVSVASALNRYRYGLYERDGGSVNACRWSSPWTNSEAPARCLVALACLGAAALDGCSVAGPRESPLPHDGPTMVAIYRQHVEEEGASARGAADVGRADDE